MKPLLVVALAALISGVVEIWPLFQERLLGPREPRNASFEAQAGGSAPDSCARRQACPNAQASSSGARSQDPPPAEGAQAVQHAGISWVPSRISIDL